MALWQIYLIVVGVMSLLTLLFFAVDKKKSGKEEAARLPEVALLTLMGMGGAPGGLVGMYVLRHKTNFKTKFHFGITVWLSAALQAGLLVLLILTK